MKRPGPHAAHEAAPVALEAVPGRHRRQSEGVEPYEEGAKVPAAHASQLGSPSPVE